MYNYFLKFKIIKFDFYFMHKLYRGFCSDDFAETWTVMARCYYELTAEV